jgi:RNA polymerase sigma-70 factor (ECF subfamily)
MTFLTASKVISNSVPIAPSHLPDSSVSNSRILEYINASHDELLDAARNSDGCAFAELCRRHAGSIQKRVFRILRNREDTDTEDALQDAICKAFVNLYCFRGACAFSTWLTQIAINSALMLMRKRSSRAETSYDQPTDQDQEWQMWEFPDRSPNPEQIYVRQQAIERMSVAVNRLSPPYRDIVQQFHGSEQSLQETAEKLGIGVGAAKSRLMRARLKIRSRLEKQRISFADTCH